MLSVVENVVIGQVQSNLENQGYRFTEKTIVNVEKIFADIAEVSFRSCNIVSMNPLTRIVNQVVISIFMPIHLTDRDVPDIPPLV